MKKVYIGLFYLFSLSNSYAVLEYSGKTYFALPHFDTYRCQEAALWHTHITTDIGNPVGLSVQIIPFVNKAVNTSAIAKHFTSKESESFSVASDRFSQNSTSVLPYHAVVHNTSLSASEANGTVTITPDFTNIGAAFSMFLDAKQSLPGIAFTLHMPLYFTTTTLTQAGGTKIMEEYFAGTYAQTTPIQNALLFGRFGKHKYTVCGPLSIALRYSLIENENNYLTLYGGAGITLKKKAPQTYLFDYHSTAFDHHKFICGLEAGATIAHYDDITIELITQVNYHYIFSGSDNRILGVYDDDGRFPMHLHTYSALSSMLPVFSLSQTYSIKQCIGQLFTKPILPACLPLPGKILTQALDMNSLVDKKKKLSLIDWPENTYAIASPLYNTTAPFTNAASTGTLESETVLLTHHLLTNDMLNITAASSPAQLSGGLTFGVGYNTKLYGFPVGFGGGLNFTAGFNNATASMLGGWLKVVVSF